MSERVFIHSIGMAVEANPGAPAIPTDWSQVYDFGITMNRNWDEIKSAAGNIFETQSVTPGLRDHLGANTHVFEPNTAEKFVAMMFATSGSRSGTGPYTQKYVPSPNNPPGKTYTMEVSDGVTSIRHFGCQVEKLAPEVSNNEIRLKPQISALGTFDGREVASIATGSPNVITLKTDYDAAPTTGLVVGDTMRIYHVADGTTTAFTVSALTGTTVSTTTTITATAGDFIQLVPHTESFNMLTPVLWSNTQFCFGSDASTALSATQTRVDPGSTWEIDFAFKDNKGEHRSGGQDPAALLRKPANATLTIKKYFDTPEDLIAYNNMAKSACVVRHYVYVSGSVYEFRVTFNHLITNDPIPKWKAGEINYSEIKYIAQMSQTDGQAFDITVVTANATLS